MLEPAETVHSSFTHRFLYDFVHKCPIISLCSLIGIFFQKLIAGSMEQDLRNCFIQRKRLGKYLPICLLYCKFQRNHTRADAVSEEEDEMSGYKRLLSPVYSICGNSVSLSRIIHFNAGYSVLLRSIYHQPELNLLIAKMISHLYSKCAGCFTEMVSALKSLLYNSLSVRL